MAVSIYSSCISECQSLLSRHMFGYETSIFLPTFSYLCFCSSLQSTNTTTKAIRLLWAMTPTAGSFTAAVAQMQTDRPQEPPPLLSIPRRATTKVTVRFNFCLRLWQNTYTKRWFSIVAALQCCSYSWTAACKIRLWMFKPRNEVCARLEVDKLPLCSYLDTILADVWKEYFKLQVSLFVSCFLFHCFQKRHHTSAVVSEGVLSFEFCVEVKTLF